MREFPTGATRDDDALKSDYEGFLSPLVIRRFGEYMTKHRSHADGKVRASDNWQKGNPLPEYMKSMWRHFQDGWECHRRGDDKTAQEESLCALYFNVQGYLHELLKQDPFRSLFEQPITREDMLATSKPPKRARKSAP